MKNSIVSIGSTGFQCPCPNCGKYSVQEETRSDTIDFKGLVLDVEELKFSVCDECKHQFETDEQFKKNQAAIRAAYTVERDRIRKRDGMLTGEEIARIRDSLHLSQRDAAVLFGGGHNAFNKYESGEVLQSGAMDRLLRMTDKLGCQAVDVLVKIVRHTKPDFTCRALSHDGKGVPSLHNANVFVAVSNKDTQFVFALTPKSSSKLNAIFESTSFIEAPSHQSNTHLQTIIPDGSTTIHRPTKFYSEAGSN